MDRAAYNMMEETVNKYLDKDANLAILDVGSYNVNGCYKPIFENNGWNYTGLDIEAGRNVDVVVDTEGKWKNLKNNSYDVVISGQCLEHCEFPWIIAKSIERVCKENGIVIISVPSMWPVHKHPIDCWRILEDGMRALMTKYCLFREIETLTYKGDGGNLELYTLFVGSKNPIKHKNLNDIEFRKPSAWSGLENKIKPYLENICPVKRIVEIGVDYGYSLFNFAKMYPEAEVIGIDPFGWENGLDGTNHSDAEEWVESHLSKYPNVKIIKETSEEARKHFDQKIDILHIDADHQYDSVKNDFELFSPLVINNGAILFHDITSYPNDIGKFFNEIDGTKYRIWEHNGLGILIKKPVVEIILNDWAGYDFKRSKNNVGENIIECGIENVLENMLKYDAKIAFNVNIVITGNEDQIDQQKYNELKSRFPFVKNVFFKNNDSYDIGAYNFGYGYLHSIGYEGNVVFMNTSVSGPHSDGWLLDYYNSFSNGENIGLHGITMNSHFSKINPAPFLPHVQSFFMFTNMSVLRDVFPTGFEAADIPEAELVSNKNRLILEGEIGISQSILDKGYGISCKAYPDFVYRKGRQWTIPTGDLRLSKSYSRFANTI